MFKVSQPIKKTVSLFTMTALLATSIVFVGTGPSHAEELPILLTAPAATSEYEVKANIPSGPVFSGTEVSFDATTGSAVVFVSQNNGEFKELNKITLVEPTTKLAVKATKKDVPDSKVSNYEYSIPELLSIEAVKKNSALTAVHIKGTIVAIQKTDLYVNDGTGAASVSISKWKDKPIFNVGTEIEVVGTPSSYNGIYKVTPAEKHALKIIGSAEVKSRVLNIAQINESICGEQVTIKNVQVAALKGTTHDITDATGKIQLYPSNVENFGKNYSGKKIASVTGIVNSYKGSLQITPSYLADIVEDENQLAMPTVTPSAGKVEENTQVELKHSDATVSIYYEVGESIETTKEPTPKSTKYADKILINNSQKVIKAIAYKDGMKESKVAVFDFFFKDLKISEIQGKGHVSAFNGKEVKNVAGYVTAVEMNNKNEQKGFYIQATGKDTDNDPETSEAIYIFTTKPVKVGNYVNVSGVVKEFTDSESSGGLSVTQIQSNDVKIVTSSEPKPTAQIIGLNGIKVPTKVIDNDQFKIFDPSEDAIDFFESIEGMLVKIEKPMVTASYLSKDKKYLTISVVSDKGQISPEKITKYNGFKLDKGSENPEIIQIGELLYKNTEQGKQAPMTGDLFKEDITGIMGYDRSNYKLLNTEKLPEFEKNPLREREVTTIVPSDDKLTVASYNIFNFSALEKEASRRNGIAKSIVENLKSPDIIGLVEMQDNNGEDKDKDKKNVPDPTNNPDGAQTFKVLIDEISKVSNGKVKYEFVQINPIYDADGGAPSANIRLGFIYNPERVKLAKAPYGTTNETVEFKNGHLTVNPGRIIPSDQSIFENARKSLVTEFVFKGQTYFVIANHFSSKSGSSALFGSQQPFVDPALKTRVKQAAVVNEFMSSILASDPKANVIALGDFNDFEFSDSALALAGTNMTNLHDKLPVGERITYIFNGSSQVLDHILVAKHMADNTQFDPVNINAMFSEDEGSVSDHDPVLMQFTPLEGNVLGLGYVNDNFETFNGKKVKVDAVVSSKVRTKKDTKDSAKNYSNLFVQDSTGAMPLYIKGDVKDLKEGDRIVFEGTCSKNSDKAKTYEIAQMSVDAVSVKIIASNLNVVPDPIKVSEFNQGRHGQFVLLNNVELIKSEGDSYKNGIFTFKTEDKEIAVKLDSRFGEEFNTYKDALVVGNKYSIKGYVEYDLKTSKATLQLDDSKDISLYEKQKEEVPLKISIISTDYKGVSKLAFEKNDMIYVQTDVKKIKDSKGNALMLYKLTREDSIQRFGSVESELIRANDNKVRYGFDTAGLPSGKYTVTVYVWDGMDSMMPVAEEAKLEITIK